MDRNATMRTLDTLGATHDRLAAAMFAVDGHPGLAFLRGSGLSGRTAERAATLAPEVTRLWAHFTAVGEVLERARAIRQGQRRLDDADWDALHLLLDEPAIALDGAGLPVDRADRAVARVVRADELAGGLERRCAELTGHLSEVDSAWSAVAGQWAPLTEAADAAVAQAAALGEPGLTAELSGRLSAARAEDLADPLSAAPGGDLRPAARTRLRELTAELDGVRRRLADLVGLRDGYPARVAGLRDLVELVAEAEARTRDAYAQAQRKIADPRLPPAPAASSVLRARLPAPGTVQSGRLTRLADELGALERSAREALERAEELRAAADGLIARRDELRGRLDAYRTKAARSGYAEDAGLTDRYQAAYDLLHTAPCLLPAATQAVHAYQRALNDLIAAAKEAKP
jgi:hypothetical protein